MTLNTTLRVVLSSLIETLNTTLSQRTVDYRDPKPVSTQSGVEGLYNLL